MNKEFFTLPSTPPVKGGEGIFFDFTWQSERYFFYRLFLYYSVPSPPFPRRKKGHSPLIFGHSFNMPLIRSKGQKRSRDWVPSFTGERISIEENGVFDRSRTGQGMRRNPSGGLNSSILLENMKRKRVTRRVTWPSSLSSEKKHLTGRRNGISSFSLSLLERQKREKTILASSHFTVSSSTATERMRFVSISGPSTADPQRRELLPPTCFGLFSLFLKEKRRKGTASGLFMGGGRNLESQGRNSSCGLSFQGRRRDWIRMIRSMIGRSSRSIFQKNQNVSRVKLISGLFSPMPEIGSRALNSGTFPGRSFNP